VRHPLPGEIRALAESSGVTASLMISMRARPTRNRLDLFTAAGSLLVDLFHGFSVAEGGTVSRRRKIARPFLEASSLAGSAAVNLVRRTSRGETAYPGLRRLVRLFYESLESGRNSPIPAHEVASTALVGDHIMGQFRD
jgi:hypothetical protein